MEKYKPYFVVSLVAGLVASLFAATLVASGFSLDVIATFTRTLYFWVTATCVIIGTFIAANKFGFDAREQEKIKEDDRRKTLLFNHSDVSSEVSNIDDQQISILTVSFDFILENNTNYKVSPFFILHAPRDFYNAITFGFYDGSKFDDHKVTHHFKDKTQTQLDFTKNSWLSPNSTTTFRIAYSFLCGQPHEDEILSHIKTMTVIFKKDFEGSLIGIKANQDELLSAQDQVYSKIMDANLSKKW